MEYDREQKEDNYNYNSDNIINEARDSISLSVAAQ